MQVCVYVECIYIIKLCMYAFRKVWNRSTRSDHDEVHEYEIERESCFLGAFNGTHRGGAVVRLFDDGIGKPSALALQYSSNDLAIERRVVLETTYTSHSG